MESDIQQRLIDLLNAVGHVGVDFGYGCYELSSDQIKEAQDLSAILTAEPAAAIVKQIKEGGE